MEYAVEKIEGNLIVLESLENQEKLVIDKDTVPFPVHENDIIIQENGIFTSGDTLARKKYLQNKLDDLF